MRMGYSVKVERKKNLPAMSIRIRKALAAEVTRSAEEIRDVAKSLAPVGSRSYVDADGTHPGALRDGIHVVEGSDPLEVEVVSEASYSAHVNYGTRTQAARPFWEPAIETIQSKQGRRYAEAIRKAIG